MLMHGWCCRTAPVSDAVQQKVDLKLDSGSQFGSVEWDGHEMGTTQAQRNVDEKCAHLEHQ